ncbi:cyclin-J18 isoform X2 [Capsicum annuum]|uniref:cyclin-J18 isoform X2 n=1 Tax=Capsicum annuum TaxID=4072 RepID=UPI0007BF4F3B|nr:cyclin-J18 isoform X2 [Capsicum annuum]
MSCIITPTVAATTFVLNFFHRCFLIKRMDCLMSFLCRLICKQLFSFCQRICATAHAPNRCVVSSTCCCSHRTQQLKSLPKPSLCSLSLVLNYEIGTLTIPFRYFEDLVMKLSEVARVGEQLRLEACMDIMDLLYEKGKISSFNCSSIHLAASIVVAAYVITVPLQKSEFPILLWVKFVTSCKEEDIVDTVRRILIHVFEL